MKNRRIENQFVEFSEIKGNKRPCLHGKKYCNKKL